MAHEEHPAALRRPAASTARHEKEDERNVIVRENMIVLGSWNVSGNSSFIGNPKKIFLRISFSLRN